MGPLSILLVILLAGLPLTAWGDEGNAARLRNQYRELRDLAQGGPFGVPLSVQSEDRDDQVSAEVYGIIEHPIEAVKAVLSSPASWCEFAPLHLNVKACTFQTQSHETFLTLYLGQKYYQTPERASSRRSRNGPRRVISSSRAARSRKSARGKIGCLMNKRSSSGTAAINLCMNPCQKFIA